MLPPARRNTWARFTSGEIYRRIETGYDDLAPTYDGDVGANPIGERMRGIFRSALLRAFSPGHVVFEIGSGTGIDALWLAHRGIEVVATDISGRMIEEVSRKARARGLSELVRCRKLCAAGIGQLASEFGYEAFDGGFSHAGALNMEPRIEQVPGQVSSLLKTGMPFICSVINKTSLFEVLFYMAVLKPRKAFRRIGGVVPIPISRTGPMKNYVVPTRFYSAHDMIRLFRGRFSVETIQAMQVFLPPSNLADEYVALLPIFAPMDRVERCLSFCWPLNSWGHHTILTFRRA